MFNSSLLIELKIYVTMLHLRIFHPIMQGRANLNLFVCLFLCSLASGRSIYASVGLHSIVYLF